MPQCRLPSDKPIPIDQLVDTATTLSPDEQNALEAAMREWDAAFGDGESEGGFSSAEASAFLASDAFETYVDHFQFESLQERQGLEKAVLYQFGEIIPRSKDDQTQQRYFQKEVETYRQRYERMKELGTLIQYASDMPPFTRAAIGRFEFNSDRLFSQATQALAKTDVAMVVQLLPRLRQSIAAYCAYLTESARRSQLTDLQRETFEQTLLSLIGDDRSHAVAAGGGVALVGGLLAAVMGAPALIKTVADAQILPAATGTTAAVTGLLAYMEGQEKTHYPSFSKPEVDVSLYRNGALERALPTTAQLQAQALTHLSDWLKTAPPKRAAYLASINWGQFIMEVSMRQVGNQKSYASLSVKESSELSQRLAWKYRLHTAWLSQWESKFAEVVKGVELAYVPEVAREAWDRNRDGKLDRDDKARGLLLVAMAPYVSHYKKSLRWLEAYADQGKGNCTSRLVMTMMANRYAPWSSDYVDGIQVYDTHVEQVTYDPTGERAIDSLFARVESPIDSIIWSPIYLCYAYLWTSGWGHEEIAEYLGVSSKQLIEEMKLFDTGQAVMVKEKPLDPVIDFPFWQGVYPDPKVDESYDPILETLRPDLVPLPEKDPRLLLGENYIAWRSTDTEYVAFTPLDRGEDALKVAINSDQAIIHWLNIRDDDWSEVSRNLKTSPTQTSFQSAINALYYNYYGWIIENSSELLALSQGSSMMEKASLADLSWKFYDLVNNLSVLKVLGFNLESMAPIEILATALGETQSRHDLNRFFQYIDSAAFDQKINFLQGYLTTEEGQKKLLSFLDETDLVPQRNSHFARYPYSGASQQHVSLSSRTGIRPFRKKKSLFKC